MYFLILFQIKYSNAILLSDNIRYKLPFITQLIHFILLWMLFSSKIWNFIGYIGGAFRSWLMSEPAVSIPWVKGSLFVLPCWDTLLTSCWIWFTCVIQSPKHHKQYVLFHITFVSLILFHGVSQNKERIYYILH